jgi:hypothetical protein
MRRPWKHAEVARLRREYADTPAPQIAERLRRTVPDVYHQAKLLGLRKSQGFCRRRMRAYIAKHGPLHGAPWTRAQRALLRNLYPHQPTTEVARRCGHSVPSTSNTARHLGLRKSKAYLASPAACRLRRGDHVGAAYWFPKGHVPANKGLRRPGWHRGRMRETQFKKSNRPHTWKPIGTELVNADGYRVRKVTDTGYPPRDWRPVHRLLWEQAYGPVPPGYAVKFIDGDFGARRARQLLPRQPPGPGAAQQYVVALPARARRGDPAARHAGQENQPETTR